MSGILMKGVSRCFARAMGVWLGCVIGGGALAMPSAGEAKEILFVAHEAKDQQAVWLPTDVVMNRSTDFTEPLVFRFDNPTDRTHVFEAPGLFESVDEHGVQVTRPVRITVPPEGTDRTVIDRERIASDVQAAEGEMVTYRFYCPLHRADADLGGRIIVGQ
ncbi:MAG: hypothetical protein FJ247_09015 [Nitrospira sp.]|nr:hypothetical protein [Nitrospira sp.]